MRPIALKVMVFICACLAVSACQMAPKGGGFGYLPLHGNEPRGLAVYRDGPGRHCAIYDVKSTSLIGLACRSGHTDARLVGYNGLKSAPDECQSPDDAISQLETLLRQARNVEIFVTGIDARRRPFVRLVIDGVPLDGISSAAPRRQPLPKRPMTSSAMTAPAMKPAYRPEKYTAPRMKAPGTPITQTTTLRVEPEPLAPARMSKGHPMSSDPCL